MIDYGACYSERGLAGNTPAQVKVAAIGAAWVLGSAVPVGDLLDLAGIGRTAGGWLSRLFSPNVIAHAAEDIPSAQSLASDLADATGGTLKELKSGYSVTVPQGSRGIMVRIMEEGGGRINYYRVSIPGKQTFTITGEVSTDPAFTHIQIGSTSLEDILNIIAGIGQ